MSALRPRELAFRGRVVADAVWLDVGLIGEAEARRRVLARWRPGCRLHRLERGWLLRLEGSRPLWPPFPGRPLVRAGGVLVAAPLQPRELAGLDAEQGGLRLPRAGVLQDGIIAEELDPGTWLELELEPVEGLRLGPVEDRAEASLERLEREGLEPAPASDGGLAGALTRAPAPEVAAPLEARLPLWARWLAWLLGAADRGLERLGTSAPDASRGPSMAPPPSTWVDALRARLSGWLLDLAALGPLSWMERAEASGLRELLSAFDRGDLDAILARAVPLGELPEGAAGAERTAQTRLAPGLGGATRLLLSGTDVRAALRTLYERAAERLLEQGRAREAAYVLADLLSEPERAVRVLVEADRVADAAALAEGRELDPVWTALLWVQADELERAGLLARRHGIWTELRARVAEEAAWAEVEVLRAWGETRWRAGDVGEALGVLSQDPRLAGLAHTWLQQVLEGAESRSAAAVHGLARAWLGPQRERVLPRVDALLTARDDSAPRRRHLLARALVRAELQLRDATDRRLARGLARALHAEPVEGAASDRLVERLLLSEADGALLRDLDPSPARSQAPVRRRWPETEVGGAPVHDLAELPDGRLLVALGGAGVRVLDSGGRNLAHLAVAADALVVDAAGGRALLVDAARRVHRLDLLQLRVEPWVEVPLTAWADRFDGERWPVVLADGVYLVDSLHSGWRHLWRVQTPDARGLSADADGVRALVGSEIWRWELPAMVLRARLPTGTDEARWFGAEAVRIETRHQADRVRVVGLSPRVLLEALPGAVLCGLAEQGRALVACRTEGGVVLHHRVGDRLDRLRLDGAARVTLRRQGARWLIGDDRGRVLALQADGGVPIDLRVGPT